MKYVIVLNGRPLEDMDGEVIDYDTEEEAEKALENARKVAPRIFDNATVERKK